MLPAPFLASQKIDPATFEANQLAAGSCPRYFRTMAGTTEEDVLLEFPEAKPVSWQRGFWAIARDSKLSCSRLAKTQKISGMDVASAIPVEALDLQPHHSVLDLCCAPGTKLLMLCERATRVVGVDVSPSRLDICRNLLVKRSKVTEAAQPMMAATSTPELYLADGRHFHPEAVSKATLNRLQAYERKESLLCFEFEDYRAVRRKLLNIRRKKSTLPDPRTEDVELSPCHPVFDRVLVDTECTHDGSFRHLEKAAHRDRFLDKKRLDELRPLQLALLARGYKLCKKGGLVVYSTCSLSPLQNETLVNAFLENTPSATLEPLETSAPHRDLGGMVLLDPVTSQTSVQFVAKIRKG